MAGGVDTNKWKPRRLRGTPAYKFCTKISLIVLAVGISSGFILNSLPFVGTLKEKVKRDFFTQTQEEIDKKYLMSLIPQHSSKKIKEIMDEEKQMFSER